MPLARSYSNPFELAVAVKAAGDFLAGIAHFLNFIVAPATYRRGLRADVDMKEESVHKARSERANLDADTERQQTENAALRGAPLGARTGLSVDDLRAISARQPEVVDGAEVARALLYRADSVSALNTLASAQATASIEPPDEWGWKRPR